MLLDLDKYTLPHHPGRKVQKRKEPPVAGEYGTDDQILKLSTRLKKAKEMMLAGEIERKEYKQIVSALETEIEKLTRRKASMDSVEHDYQRYLNQDICLLKSIDQPYEKADLEKRQQIVGVIFPERLVYGDGGIERLLRIHLLE